MVTKREVLDLVDDLSAEELQIVYTFINEYRAAEGNEDDSQKESCKIQNNKQHEDPNILTFYIPPHSNPFRRRRRR